MSRYADYINQVENELIREWLTRKTKQGGDTQLFGLVGYAPGIQDAFHRVRVSEPFTLFESINEFDLNPLQWEAVTVGTASATHEPNTSTVALTIGTDASDKVFRQTHRYYPYQAGKSQLIKITFCFGQTKTNNVQQVMYGDDSNGIGFRYSSSGVSLFLRKNGVETVTNQSDWNIDTLDGSGQSKETLNPTKSQIFVIDIQWLGVGNPVCYFEIGRQLVPVHQFMHANVVTSTYMKTARLPVRYEIYNTGTTSDSTTLTQICTEIESEGGRQENRRTHTASNGVTLRSVTATPLPIIAIRADLNAPAGGSVVNRRSVFIENIDIFSQDSEIYWRVLFNPTVTGGSWSDVDGTYSCVQVNKTATSVSGGIEMDSGYIPASASQKGVLTISFDSDYAMTTNYNGTVGDVLCLELTRITTTSSDCGAALTWREV